MPDTPIDERRFTEREVREILKRAVEKVPSRALTNSEGLSLAALQAIGEEVGIDPARIEGAARSLVHGSGRDTNTLLGAPRILHVERKVAGTLTPDDTADILSRIRRIMGRRGEANEIHGTLEWTATGESGERSVTLSSRDGTTTIQSSANLTSAALGIYLPAGMMGFIASFAGLAKFIKSGTEFGLVLALVTLPVLWPVLRSIFRRISRSEAAKAQQMVEELANLIERRGR